ncbi:glycosyltransferase family 2 protein [Chitinophaga sp.]|uniref:glycosyltransferase family 2 protein n=1 Tax=Chitinophaga sp. TaxID=1869181 RepID=UPI0031D4E9C3
MQVSLSISTYNWPAALEVCLLSVLGQTVLPAEVLVADDGSGTATRDLILSYQQRFPVPLKHIWQADEGFRLAGIRNKAILAATQPYIVQIDGDVILHPQFVEDHIRFARPGCFATGSRVLMGEALSKEVLTTKNINATLLRKNSKNFFNSLHMPWISGFLAHRYKKDPFDVKGCNMAFWKTDLEKVNGYNEVFTGWGREDSELAIRLVNAGVRKRFLKGGGIMYHIHHREASRGREAENDRLLAQTRLERRTFVEEGLSRHIAH